MMAALPDIKGLPCRVAGHVVAGEVAAQGASGLLVTVPAILSSAPGLRGPLPPGEGLLQPPRPRPQRRVGGPRQRARPLVPLRLRAAAQVLDPLLARPAPGHAPRDQQPEGAVNVGQAAGGVVAGDGHILGVLLSCIKLRIETELSHNLTTVNGVCLQQNG